LIVGDRLAPESRYKRFVVIFEVRWAGKEGFKIISVLSRVGEAVVIKREK